MTGHVALIRLMLVSFILVFGQVRAEPAGKTEIVFGGTVDYPPFHYLDKHGHPQGYDVDLFKAVAKGAGLSARFELGDWEATLDALAKGKIDVVPMFESTERSRLYDFSTPLLSRYHVFFGRKEEPTISGLNALGGQTVIVQRGGFASSELRRENVDAKLILTDEEPEALRLLSAGKYDYALAPEIIGRYAIKKYALRNVTTKSRPVLTRDYVFAVMKGNQALLNRIDDGLDKVLASGEYDAIYEKWLANLHSRDEIKKPLVRNFTLFGGALVVVIVVIYISSRRLRARFTKQSGELSEEQRLRRDAEDKVAYLAYHDALTGLPNRNKFISDLEQRIGEAASDHSSVGVFCFKVSNLAQINQLAGQLVGDKLLQFMGEFLRESYGTNACSLSPGYFAVRHNDVENQVDAYLKARSLLDKLQRPRKIDEVELKIACRGGLAIYPEDSDNANGLIRNAELAQTISQDTNREIRKYSRAFEPDPRNLQLLAELPDAIIKGELQLYCQPKLDIRTKTIMGGEVLIRWEHPRYGFLGPNVFVPLAEKTGLIRQITLHIIERLSEYINQNCDGENFCCLSVNVSAQDMSDPEFARHASAIVRQVGARFIFEITETGAMEDPEEVLRTVGALRKHGVRLSVDDFGTGYSSLSYLKQLRPEELKIDQTFIKDLLDQKNDQILVKSTITMAHNLGIKVVAEGVEDMETARLLKKMGCDILQGYLISKPAPLQNFQGWVESNYAFALT